LNKDRKMNEKANEFKGWTGGSIYIRTGVKDVAQM
jgi:hypothetical protein